MNRIYPAALSFFLPGLGQVFEGRALIGAIFFFAYAPLIFIPLPSLFPFFILGASIEAFLRANKNSERDLAREILFGLAGLLGLFAWTNLWVVF